MKILWLINIALPEASLLLKEKESPFGGWLVNMSKNLSKKKEIDLSIAFPHKKIREIKILRGEKITYYAFKQTDPSSLKKLKEIEVLEKILDNSKPDIVHIHGTEFAHTLLMIDLCEKRKIKTVVSIQGLVSIIPEHLNANLPFKVIYGATFRNIILRDNIFGLKHLFKKRGVNEINAIKKVKNIIGRTTWDLACTNQINPKAKYFFCNESLRNEFYNHVWDITKIERYSLFLSQGQYSLKGLHYVLKALPLILKEFPKVKIYISGKDITKSDSLKDRLLKTYYGKYIKKLIKENNIKNNIIFTGPLDEKEMCTRFMKSHIFISPSTIENESNSLSEAKILGVPSIASFVGGVTDRIDNKVDGFLYQHDAYYMIAFYVCQILRNDKLALELSKNSRKNALEIHDMNKNTKKLIEIYMEIFNYQ